MSAKYKKVAGTRKVCLAEEQQVHKSHHFSSKFLNVAVLQESVLGLLFISRYSHSLHDLFQFHNFKHYQMF